jgi:hypothetical protein
MATTTLTIDEQARALAAAIVTERRAFETLGTAAAGADGPAAKLALAAISRHHGEHAIALEALLPATRDHEPGGLVAAAEAEPASLGPGPREVVEAVIARHEATLAGLTPVADGPALRVLAAIVAEERADLARLP